MKILHVSYSDSYGGANIAAYRIYKSQQKKGLVSDFLVINKKKKDKKIREYIYKSFFFNKKLRNYIVKFIDFLSQYKKNSYNILPSGIHEFINQSKYDLVNFHWINNEMLSVKEISKVRKKIFWTFHDLWPILGSQHYIIKKKNNFFKKKLNISNFFKLNKKKYLSKIDFNIISPSLWLKNKVKKSFLKKKNIFIIRNPINTDFWKIKKKKNNHKKIKILFVSVDPYTDKRKGYNKISKILEKLDVSVYIVGSNNKINLPKNFTNLGYISSNYKLRNIYNFCDAVIIPSEQDNFPNVALESMSCGTPIIVSKHSGLKEIINNVNGKVLDKFNKKNIKKAINWLHNIKNRDRIKIRKFCLKYFSYKKISDEYLKCYKKILNGKKNKYCNSNI